MQRLLRIVENKRLDLTPMPTHTFQFNKLDEAFEMLGIKEGDIIRRLTILFD